MPIPIRPEKADFDSGSTPFIKAAQKKNVIKI
jgi:hypothetical protein